MNDENLIPNSQRSPEEVRENGRKGGIKSGEVRRQKRDMRKLMAIMMDEKTPKGDMTYVEKMTQSLLTIASSPSMGAASVKAYQTIAHMMGMDEPEPETQDYDSDGFIEALNNQADETMNEAGDIVEE